MTIQENGYVGIGIQDPTKLLDVNGDVHIGGEIETDNGIIVGGDLEVAGTVAPFTVDQPSTSGAIPVITLDQADISEPFIEFLGGRIATGKSGTNKYLEVKADGGGTYYLRLFD